MKVIMGILATLVIVLFVFCIVTLFSVPVVSRSERILACGYLGYDGYYSSLDSCYSGEGPMILYPYEKAFDRIE